MYSVQSTISEYGIGLFSGKHIKLTISPSFKKGIWFKNKNGLFSELSIDNIFVDNHNTSIVFSDNNNIKLIEHLLAAVFSFGITTAVIEVNGDEIPLFDGSSNSYVFLLKQLILEPEEVSSFAKLNKSIEVKDGDFYVKATPSTNLSFSYTINFKNTPIGKEKYKYVFSKKSFIEEISMARTFGVIDNLEMAKSFYKGATLQNVIIVSNGKMLSKTRIDKEFVKHKILDAIGDLRTFKYPLIFKYESYGGSHKLNHALLKKIQEEKAFYLVEVIHSVPLISVNNSPNPWVWDGLTKIKDSDKIKA